MNRLCRFITTQVTSRGSGGACVPGGVWGGTPPGQLRRFLVRRHPRRSWAAAHACLAAVALVLFVVVSASTVTADDALFVYVSDDDSAADAIRCEVTTRGLASIKIGDHPVAAGGWTASDASWIYGSPAPDAGAPAGTMEVLAANRVRVRHEGAAVTTTFTYEFSGHDVRIHARVENFGDTTFRAVSFSGLSFTFPETPTGYFHSHDRGFVERMAQMNGLFHPCWWHQFGGSYLVSGEIGIGLSPRYRELTRTLFWWRGGKELVYLVDEPIPPEGALAFEMVMRISRSTDWRHLLEPYRDHFRETFGPVRYHADHRPIGSTTLAHSSHVTADNPYGFSWWRLDRPGGDGGSRGMTEFAAQTAESIRRANGQGIISWVVTGWSPRGMNFRPDFDVMPPAVEENFPIWRRIYQREGLKMGALARPAEFPTPVSWNTDGRVWLAAEDPPLLHDAQTIPPLQVMINRFRNMKQRGFRLFYLDVYGVTYSDAKSMRHFRNELGPDILTFAEFWTDVVLVNTGAYLHYRWDEKAGKYQDTWRRDHLWEMMRWLIPGVQGMAPCGESAEAPRPGDNAPGRVLYERGVTPMVWQGTRSSNPIADELRPLVDEFLDEHGGWKISTPPKSGEARDH